MQDEDIEALAAQGEKLRAIKLYRVRYQVDLPTAKDAVEAMTRPPEANPKVPTPEQRELWESDQVAAIREFRRVNPDMGLSEAAACFETPESHSSASVSSAQLRLLLTQLETHGRVHAIKTYRSIRGAGLKEARDAVDALVVQYNVKVKDTRCFIATAAYGTPYAAELDVLRTWRDECLMPHAWGRTLVTLYYRMSPPLARWVAAGHGRRAVVRALLTPWIRKGGTDGLLEP